MKKKLIKYKEGNVIEDNQGQYNHPGQVTKINSNRITMKNIPYSILGVSNTGHKQMMYPEQEYAFNGSSVTEYPIIEDPTNPNFRNKQEHDKYYIGKVVERLKNEDPDLYTKYNESILAGDQDGAMAMVMAGGGIPIFQSPRQEFKPSNPTNFKEIGFKSKKTEGFRYDINRSDKDSITNKGRRKYQDGGQFSMNDMPQNGATQIQLDNPYQSQDMFGSYYDNSYTPIKNKKSKQIGTYEALQGVNAVGRGLQSNPSEEEGPSGAQKAVGQFGPWGAAISQVSQGVTNKTDQSNSAGVYTAGKAIFDPAAAWSNKDLSKRDKVLGGLNPIYGGIKAFKAKKAKEDQANQLDRLVKKAGSLQDVDANKRKYWRPEDQLVDPNETFPTYGVGTNYLKNGGNISSMEQKGELQTYRGGEAETISENPYLPESGETIMFKGKSHAEGGIGMKFGGSSVEVEGGEPAVKLKEGGSESNLVIFGDMKIPSYGVSELNDPNAKNKKFKNYISDLSKIEEKQNKIIDKSIKTINNTEVTDSFDRLKLSTGKAMITGANMKLKDVAAKKQIASGIQNAILETADELGLKSNELSRGKFKKAKQGMKIAQDGSTIPRSRMGEYQSYGYNLDPENPNRLYRDLTSNPTSVESPMSPPGKGSEEFNRAFGEARKQKSSSFDWKGKTYTTDLFQSRPKTTTIPGKTTRDYIYLEDDYIPTTESTNQTPSNKPQITNNGNGDWLSVLNGVIPYVRPSNQRPLDPNQISGERYALASNQLESVKAQRYQPLLEKVSDISLQDQLNVNQSDFNALKRLTAANPAAQSTLAAQKYQANSAVLGEQFRENQAQKMGVYNKNREILNDATLKNLGILDQQYVRQAQAKSNTKAVAQQALNSIADKIAKNKLENRTLGVYENLYNYRYDNKGRAINMNQAAQFMIDNGAIKVDDDGKIVMDENKVKRDKNGLIINSTQTQRVTDKKKNGGIVKAIKSL